MGKLREKRDGPYVQAAAICEQVIEDKQGVLSLIRLVDRITINIAGAAAPEKMPPVAIPIKVVVMLKAGGARGSHEICVTPEAPDGTRLPSLRQTVLFESEDRGLHWVIQPRLEVTLEGVYWIDVALASGQLLTRIPLRIVYQRTTTG